ncbi:MAG TPA: hypothetical protein VFF05_04750, partial [Rudaea sp.]|nr:hypothetical protein [Rudaea sp.]
MDQGFRLFRSKAFGEELPLEAATFVEGKLRGGFDGVDGRKRREQATLLLARRFASGRENRRVIFRAAKLAGAIARFRRRLARDFARKGDCTGQQVALDQSIDDPALQTLRGGNGIALRAHLHRLGHASQPRQALRAVRAGNQAQLHFRLAELRVLRGDAVMPRHSQFEPAAQRVAVNGHHQRLRRILDAIEQIGEAGRSRRFRGTHL